jgi:hypothetical protein
MSRERAFAKRRIALLLACAAGLAPTLGWTQSVPEVTGSAAISSGVLAGAAGMLAVNEAAGLDNAQGNQAAIAAGANASVVSGGAQSASAAARVPRASTTIEGGAFANATGAVMVNQAAGAANVQRNSLGLGAEITGVVDVSDSELSAAVTKNGRLDQSATGRGVREVSIGNGAFSNVSGIAQINQTAGVGNATANSFVLRPPAGTLF